MVEDDAMITNDVELEQTVAPLEGMYRALAALQREVYPANPLQLASLAEGREEEIRRQQSEIETDMAGNELKR